MIFIFWGIIFLMTGVAIVWVLFAGRNRHALPRWASVTIMLLLPMCAWILYWYLGDAQVLFRSWVLHRQEKTVKSALLKIKNPQQLIDRLCSYLEKHPNNTKAWYLLGKLYYGQRDYAQAVMALKKAYQQAPQHVSYAVSYAQASFFERGQRLEPNIKTLLLRVLKQHKKNVGALNLLAIDAYFQGRYRLAVQYWERCLPLFPIGSKDQQFLLTMISKAQKKEK